MPLENEPLTNVEAKQLARAIVFTGGVLFSPHAIDEMEEDDLAKDDCLRIIRGGVCEGCDFEKGTWRYRFYAQNIYVVIAFRSEERLSVVTAWRKK